MAVNRLEVAGFDRCRAETEMPACYGGPHTVPVRCVEYRGHNSIHRAWNGEMLYTWPTLCGRHVNVRVMRGYKQYAIVRATCSSEHGHTDSCVFEVPSNG